MIGIWQIVMGWISTKLVIILISVIIAILGLTGKLYYDKHRLTEQNKELTQQLETCNTSLSNTLDIIEMDGVQSKLTKKYIRDLYELQDRKNENIGDDELVDRFINLMRGTKRE